MLSALLDTQICYSHFLLLSPIGSALCRTARAIAPGHEEVHLSWGLLLTEDCSEPHASYLGVPKLLAILKTSCETYVEKAVSRELFFPSGDFMEADIHMAGILMSASWSHELRTEVVEELTVE